MKILEVSGLSKTFNLHILHNKKIEALKNIDFSMEEGEIIGLTGKSGSGKSSLMKCIYRTYLASTGTILYHSDKGKKDLVQASDHEMIELRKTEITYCSQFLSVIPRVTAIDVVCENLFRVEKNKEIARAKAREILAYLGLAEELWDAFPATFSGGEQQRINLARAVLGNPKFLLIDEPTASLDAKTKEAVIRLILNLKKQGSSVICISHDDYTIDQLVDRNIEMQNGTIVSIQPNSKKENS